MKTINISEDYQLSRVQENAAKAFDDLETQFQILNGVFIPASIAAADTPVNHTLKRKLKGWAIVGKTGPGDVYESSTDNPRPNDQIILKSSAAVNVTLYFF